MALIKLNNRAVKDATAFGSITSLGSLTFISKQTASSSASISFTGIDSTYKEYMFIFNSIHPQTDSVEFQFNMSTDSGSNYNVTKTTTLFTTYHSEADDATTLQYDDSRDMAQGTGYAILGGNTGNDNDQASSGYLHLFNPSSNVYVKHFISNFSNSHSGDYTYTNYVAGYGNTTSAINAIDFKMSSGNIDDGIIKLYGVS